MSYKEKINIKKESSGAQILPDQTVETPGKTIIREGQDTGQSIQ